jgi:hypothetical protein
MTATTIDPQALIGRALSHPTRIRILMTMNSPRRRLSPKLFADETGESLGTTAYHFRELERLGCIEMVGTAQRRGATEHYFEPTKRAMAWTEGWKQLPDWVKQNLCATALTGFVRSVGAAVDAGTFDAREDSHLSWDAIRVDDGGWAELTALMNRTLEEAIAIGERAEQRLAHGDAGEPFIASYALSCFEAPPSVD